MIEVCMFWVFWIGAEAHLKPIRGIRQEGDSRTRVLIGCGRGNAAQMAPHLSSEIAVPFSNQSGPGFQANNSLFAFAPSQLARLAK